MEAKNQNNIGDTGVLEPPARDAGDVVSDQNAISPPRAPHLGDGFHHVIAHGQQNENRHKCSRRSNCAKTR